MECMITGSRANEGRKDKNKKVFDENFDDVAFPKAKENSADRREREKKNFIRLVLIGSWDEEEDGLIGDRDIEEIVNQTYERCGGLEY